MWQAAPSGVFNAQNISQARITYAPCGPQLAAGHIEYHNEQAQFRQVDAGGQTDSWTDSTYAHLHTMLAWEVTSLCVSIVPAFVAFFVLLGVLYTYSLQRVVDIRHGICNVLKH